MSKKNIFPVRHRMVFGTFILALIVLFDRILISAAKDPISNDLSLSNKQI
jgi:ACS family glucarate transporter-like MFS transporter